ncbi:hypothetical protein niasHS_005799 [Heterodera schachtii]|uniref:G-protein coupled receptors family 3 profile domain-containing protein n=1 Tax=Heterodera schachtii TaxID=97005 RepID=A0ABD2JZV3_HETSC
MNPSQICLLAFCLQIAQFISAGGIENPQNNGEQRKQKNSEEAEANAETEAEEGTFKERTKDVVAIQWALAHWNEQMPPSVNGAKEKETTQFKFGRPKLGLFAGESCSQPKEAISQTLRFLDSVGYHEPSGCANSEEEAKRIAELPKLIGLLMPKDRQSAESVAQMLRPAALPIAAFSAASAQALVDANVRRFTTTAPLFTDYVKTLVELLKMLGSDLVSIVDFGDDFVYTPLLQEKLRAEGISTAEVVSLDHPMLPSILSASDAKIIVSLVPHRILRNARLGELRALVELHKLWVGIDIELDGGTDAAATDGEGNAAVDFLPEDSELRQNAKLQFVTIRRRVRQLKEFSAYFLRVLQSNHAHYTLLRAYAEQVFDCDVTVGTGRNCTDGLLSAERMAKLHRQSNTAEAAILLTYALARATEWIQSKKELAQKCTERGSFAGCHDAIRTALLSFSPNDRLITSGSVRMPPGFAKQLSEMNFFETPEGVVQLTGIGIEAILAEREDKDGANLYRLLEYRTTDAQKQKNVEKFVVPQKLRQFRSRCPQFRPFCGDRCELATRRSSDNTFLSIPQQYPFFIAAIFDLKGPNCGLSADAKGAAMGQEIALPLAFVHAVSTFRRRNSPQSLLFNSDQANPMDIGAVLVDTCSSGRELLEFLVDSERNCYKFSQAERNWTVAAGATIGYIIGAQHDANQDGIIQAMFEKAETSPVIGVGTDQPGQISQKGPLFTEGPNHRSTALALAQFLRQMHWQYVNVVLDRSSFSSVALFKQFDRIASLAGICFADLAIIGEQRGPNPTMERESENEDGAGEGEEAHLKRTKAKRGSSAAKASAATEEEQRRRFTGVGPPSANVTLVFASAEQAAEYMGVRVQFGGTVTGIPTVHVMLGDAHNFHLHDPTNLAQFAGTLSFQGKDFATVEFQNWLQTVTPLSLPEPWFWRYVEETWHCSLFRNSFSHFNGRMCTGEERLNVKGMGRLSKAGNLAKGVDRLLKAIDKAHKKLCTREKLCDEFIENGRKLTREYLRKSAKEESAEIFEVFEFVPIDHHGNFDYSLMANLSLSRTSTDSSAGAFSPNNNPSMSDIAINFFADYRPFAYGVPITRDSPSATVISRCKSPFCKCPLMMSDDFHFGSDVSAWLGHNSVFRREPSRQRMAEISEDDEFLLRENMADEPEIRELSADAVDREVAWAIRAILLSLSALLSAIAVGTLLCILFKIWRRTIRGSQSLGILLLLGIITMHLSAFLFTTEGANEPFLCLLRIALPAMAHAICFGVIIVKAVQLRNAELLSSSGGAFAQQISYWNYWLLLFFIVTVQTVICFRWILPDVFWPLSPPPPMAMPSPFFALRCPHSSALFLLAQIYTFFLLFLALFLSAQNRSIKRNYKEAKWLFITSLICSLILIAWAVFHTLVSVQHMEYLSVLELHLTGSILLAFVFGPKLYVLLFYEPVVVQFDTDGCAHGDKALDLFEAADWVPHSLRDRNAHSPTLSTRSSDGNEGRNTSNSLNNHNNSTSRLNSGNSSMRGKQRRANDDGEEEKVTSAFHTVMRKKTSTGSNAAHKLHRTVSESARNSARDSFCAGTTATKCQQ